MNKVFTYGCLILFLGKACQPENIQPKELHYISERTKDSTHYHIVSTSVSPIEITLKKTDSNNPAIVIKETSILDSKDTLLNAVSASNAFADTLEENDIVRSHVSSRFEYGNPNEAYHDESYRYSLPIEIGKKVRISQGFNGPSSHNSIASKYAVDFDIPVGTKVYAARNGVVVYALGHFKKSGDRSYTKKANKIVILHEDGTFASYSHLAYKGALVKKGDRIQRGQLIGYSGNTGYSRGPHLHFAVRLPRDICVPIYFEGYEGKDLKKGDWVMRSK